MLETERNIIEDVILYLCDRKKTLENNIEKNAKSPLFKKSLGKYYNELITNTEKEIEDLSRYINDLSVLIL